MGNLQPNGKPIPTGQVGKHSFRILFSMRDVLTVILV